MSTIRISEPHEVSKDKARARMGAFDDQLSKFGAKLAWQGHTAEIKGIGVSGGVVVNDADVQVTIKLGLMAKAAGVDPNRLEGSVKRRIAAALAGEG